MICMKTHFQKGIWKSFEITHLVTYRCLLYLFQVWILLTQISQIYIIESEMYMKSLHHIDAKKPKIEYEFKNWTRSLPFYPKNSHPEKEHRGKWNNQLIRGRLFDARRDADASINVKAGGDAFFMLRCTHPVVNKDVPTKWCCHPSYQRVVNK